MKVSTPRLVASLTGASGICAAAFGAHGLEKIATPEQLLWWTIAVSIQLVTAPVLVVAALHPDRIRAVAGWLWFGGLVLFSGSLYAMAVGGPRILGAVTPLGGLALIAGWLSLLWPPSNSLRD